MRIGVVVARIGVVVARIGVVVARIGVAVNRIGKAMNRIELQKDKIKNTEEDLFSFGVRYDEYMMDMFLIHNVVNFKALERLG